MKILITNHHLQENTGTEVSTITLAKYLKKTGHNITIYSKYIYRPYTKKVEKLGIRVVEGLDLIKNEKFDIIHGQHNICIYEARYYFPNTPIIMWVHGTIPFLESPPVLDLNISTFLVNNTEGFEFVKNIGIQKEQIIIFRNIVDTDLFKKTKKLHKIPKKALIISNKISEEKEKILKKVLEKEKIKSKFIGRRFTSIENEKLPKIINKFDIVFTLGLGAIESMLCGRIPISFDNTLQSYDDGMVTSQNFKKLMEFNFSGRATKQIISEEGLSKEIKKYNAKDGNILMQKSQYFYGATNQIKKIIKIYKKSIKNYSKREISENDKKILETIVNIINETKYHSIYITNKISDYDEISKFKKSKTYKIWQKYNQFLRKIKIKPPEA